MVRVFTAAVLAGLLLAGAAAAATQLNRSNSTPFRFAARSVETATGVGCGATATITKTLPVGSSPITVIKPKLGERDDVGGTQVTAIATTNATITISVLANGPQICDPLQAGGPVDTIQWQATYSVESEQSRRIQVPVRLDFAGSAMKSGIRPRTLWNGKGSTGEKMTGMKWKRFGARKATGFGKLNQLYCRSGDTCPNNHRKVKLVLTNPGYCSFTSQIEYRMIRGYVGGRLYFATGDKRDGGGYCGL